MCIQRGLPVWRPRASKSTGEICRQFTEEHFCCLHALPWLCEAHHTTRSIVLTLYQFSLFTLCELFSRLIDDHHNPAVHSPAYVISVLPFLFFLLLSFASLLSLSWLQHPTSCFLIVVSLTHLHLLNTMMITIKKPQPPCCVIPSLFHLWLFVPLQTKVNSIRNFIFLVCIYFSLSYIVSYIIFHICLFLWGCL